MTSRVLSGIQPTGNLHLGNYLGAIVHWVRMQEEHPCLFCIVDLHAITVWQDPAALRANTLEMAAALLASGIDPAKAILFVQSHAPQHAELGWVLNCVARIGWLNRMVQFKEKAGKDREGASVGLYSYPVLQAADILIYMATHVPVGEDQKQHLELARDIAQKFNTDYGVELFPLPEPIIQGPATRVMSLRDGAAKMSKSDPSDFSRINLTDGADTIAQKIRKAKTDPEPLPDNEAVLAGRPEALNLVGIYAAVAGMTRAQVLQDFAGKGFGTFKPALTEQLVTRLAPVADKFNRLRADPGYLQTVLGQGADQAQALAANTLRSVYETVGFLTRRA